MDSYLSMLEAFANNYDGSTEYARTIESMESWYEFLYGGSFTQEYTKKCIIPVYRKLKKALETSIPEDKRFVNGVVEKLTGMIEILKNYVKTGEFKCISDEKMEELLALAKKNNLISK